MDRFEARKKNGGWKVIHRSGATIAVTPQNILPRDAERLADILTQVFNYLHDTVPDAAVLRNLTDSIEARG